ncbi:MAG: MCE family protein [Spirochaetes bacterium]|nr:MAG: MCE family protein [Spirochaetota bacterium]
MKLSNEARVGLMVTVSFTIFLLLVGILAKINVAQSGYRLKVYFGFLNDLRISAPVKIAGGIRIGQVEEISQSSEKTEVTVWIDRKFKLIKSTKFAIFTTGIIGEKYINVFVPPSLDVEDFLGDGDKVYGIDPPSFDQMMLTFQGFMQDKSGGEILAEIFQNSNRFVANLNKMVDENRYDVKQSVSTARVMIETMAMDTKILIEQLNLLSRNLAQISEKNKEEVSITMRNLSEVAAELNKVIFRIESGRGTLGKLLTDEEVYNNLRDASVYARDLFYSLKQDPSKLFYRTKQ